MMLSIMSANCWFPTRGRPKTTESTSTLEGRFMRSMVASSNATAAPSEWPVQRTRVKPEDDRADCTVESTRSAVRPWVSWKPSCTRVPSGIVRILSHCVRLEEAMTPLPAGDGNSVEFIVICLNLTSFAMERIFSGSVPWWATTTLCEVGSVAMKTGNGGQFPPFG